MILASPPIERICTSPEAVFTRASPPTEASWTSPLAALMFASPAISPNSTSPEPVSTSTEPKRPWPSTSAEPDLRLDARALGAGHGDEHLGVAEDPATAVADVDHDLVAVAAVAQLDPRVLDGGLARVVVAERLEHDRRLLHLGGLDPDLARAEADVEAGLAGSLEGLRPHRGRLTGRTRRQLRPLVDADFDVTERDREKGHGSSPLSRGHSPSAGCLIGPPGRPWSCARARGRSRC